jgi:hypothetical protein
LTFLERANWCYWVSGGCAGQVSGTGHCCCCACISKCVIRAAYAGCADHCYFSQLPLQVSTPCACAGTVHIGPVHIGPVLSACNSCAAHSSATATPVQHVRNHCCCCCCMYQVAARALRALAMLQLPRVACAQQLLPLLLHVPSGSWSAARACFASAVTSASDTCAPTCELTFSLVGMTVRPVAAQVGTCNSNRRQRWPGCQEPSQVRAHLRMTKQCV